MLKPYYDHAGIVIYNGDCRDILPSVKADLVLTDPPYGIAYETSWRSRNDKLRCPVANDTSLDVVADSWPMVLACLPDNAHWYAFASTRNIPLAEVVFGPKQWLFWDKGDRGTVGDLKCGYAECVEAVAYGMKGRREFNGKRPRNIIRVDWSGAMDPVHPTVKPVPLLEDFVQRSSIKGEVVLDPFAGSGTTMRAAKNLGRQAIGIEIEEKYCEIAAKRMAQEVLL